MKFLAAVRILLALVVACGTAAAHEIRPAIVTAALGSGPDYAITIAANIEALLAGIGPDHVDSDTAPSAPAYNELRAASPDALRAKFDAFARKWLDGLNVEFDGKRAEPRLVSVDVPAVGDLKLARISTIRLAGPTPDGARTFRWSYAAAFGSSVLRIERGGRIDPDTSWLKDGATSEPISLVGGEEKSRGARFLEYVALGFTHILPKGLDHILFVLGLYLLSTDWRSLLIQVTAFTVAHSITLALGLYGVVEVAPSIVEPLIAASIVYVAVENMLTSKLQPWRPFIVFGFGLLHGLGFAGVLQELGLPRADFVTGLIGFNVGVELGQLAVIALAWVATGWLFRHQPWYRARIVWPASAAIALAGLYWTVERVMAG